MPLPGAYVWAGNNNSFKIHKQESLQSESKQCPFQGSTFNTSDYDLDTSHFGAEKMRL